MLTWYFFYLKIFRGFFLIFYIWNQVICNYKQLYFVLSNLDGFCFLFPDKLLWLKILVQYWIDWTKHVCLNPDLSRKTLSLPYNMIFAALLTVEQVVFLPSLFNVFPYAWLSRYLTYKVCTFIEHFHNDCLNSFRFMVIMGMSPK